MLETNGQYGAPPRSSISEKASTARSRNPFSPKSSDFAHYRVVLMETKPGRDGAHYFVNSDLRRARRRVTTLSTRSISLALMQTN